MGKKPGGKVLLEILEHKKKLYSLSTNISNTHKTN